MRVLILGLGSIGSRHARLVQSLGHEVVGFDICDRQLPGVKTVAAAEAGLELADAAIVATPSHDHYSSARMCLDAGIPTLVEKPLALNSRDGRELASRSERASVPLGVAMNLRFHPGPQSVHATLEKGLIGRPLRAAIWCGSWLPAWRPDVDYRDTYSASAPAGGGVLLDVIHEIDYLLWLLGPVRRVSAVLAHVSELETDTEDIALLTAELSSGAVAQVALDYVDRAYHRGCRIVASSGTVEWSWERAGVWVFRAESSTPEFLAVGQGPDEMYRAELSQFLSVVETGAPPAVSALDAVRALEVVEAARESARTHASITLVP